MHKTARSPFLLGLKSTVHVEAHVLVISILAGNANSFMTTEMIWLYNGTILFVHYHVGHDLIEIYIRT